jgi:N-methylhydantoinase B
MVAYHQPRALVEALSILKADPSLRVLAGGTDVYPAKATRAGWGRMQHPGVLDISRLDGLRGIEDRGDHWWIGALTTWSDLLRTQLPPLFDGLKAAAREVGGRQIQNRGTLAGNLCNASAAADGVPPLLTLEAQVALAAPWRTRVLPLDRFLVGPRQTALAAGELVTGIEVPQRAGVGLFRKLGARRYLVISIAMAAGVIDLDAEGRVRRSRIAVGACSGVAQRLADLERDLLGKRPTAGLVTPAHVAALDPIDDVRASAAYRRAAALQLVRDLMASAAEATRRAA